MRCLGVPQVNKRPRDAKSPNDAATILEAAVARLPEDYKTAVRLYDLEGRPIAEVAANMERSVGAVHMLRARAHDRLRQDLGASSQYFSGSA